MLVTYPDTPAHKHICGTVAATPTCIHSALHLLGSIAPFREDCTISGALHQLGRGVMLPKWCNTTKEQELSRQRRNKLTSNGGFARHEPPTRRRHTLRTPQVVQNPHCSRVDEHECEESGLRCPTIWIGNDDLDKLSASG